MNKTTFVVRFENKPVVLTEAQYSFELSKQLYEKQSTSYILYKMNCLDEEMNLVSIVCPIKELFVVGQLIVLVIMMLIWCIRFSLSIRRNLNDLQSISCCEEYKELVVRTRRGVRFIRKKIK